MATETTQQAQATAPVNLGYNTLTQLLMLCVSRGVVTEGEAISIEREVAAIRGRRYDKAVSDRADLLAALKDLANAHLDLDSARDAHPDDQRRFYPEYWNARAAIAKATGVAA